MEFMELSKSDDKNAVCVVVDRFSKEIKITTTTTQYNSKELVQILCDKVLHQSGFPKSIVLYQGPQFCSLYTQEVARLLGVHWKMSTAFHPQTDGQTKRVNQDIQQYL